MSISSSKSIPESEYLKRFDLSEVSEDGKYSAKNEVENLADSKELQFQRWLLCLKAFQPLDDSNLDNITVETEGSGGDENNNFIVFEQINEFSSDEFVQFPVLGPPWTDSSTEIDDSVWTALADKLKGMAGPPGMCGIEDGKTLLTKLLLLELDDNEMRI